jgi:hypothetical protein
MEAGGGINTAETPPYAYLRMRDLGSHTSTHRRNNLHFLKK